MNKSRFLKTPYYLLIYLLLNCLTVHGQNDIFFSEYIEDGRNKCLELFNPTNKTIDLSNYTIEIYINGSSSPVGTPWSFQGRRIGPMSVIVLCQGLSDVTLLSIRDYPFGFGNFNGDDAVVLKNNGRILDIIGKIGCDPGTSWVGGSNKTEDVVLVRNACVDRGITSSGGNCKTFKGLESDWTAYSKTDYSHLGKHNFGSIEVEIFGKNALCEQTEVTLTATAGFRTYKWSNGSNTAQTTVTTPGVYTVTVTTAQNCKATKSKTIKGKSPEIFAEIKDIKNVSCLPKADGGFTVVPRGGDGSGRFTYEWETGSSTRPVIRNLKAGDYKVTVTDNSGCSAVSEVTVGGTASFSMNVTAKGETCRGRRDGSINIFANGNGIEYSIDGRTFQNSGFFDNVHPDAYDVLAVDNNGCGNQEKVTVKGGTPFDLRNSEIKQSKCQAEGGAEIRLIPNGGKRPYSVSFDGGPFILNDLIHTNLKGDTFAIVIRDASGCEKSFEQIIEKGSDLMVTGYDLIPATCAGVNDGGINIKIENGSGDISFNKATNTGILRPYFSPNFEGLAIGHHTISVRDNPFDCRIPIEFKILEKAPLLTNIVNATPCRDDSTGTITVLPQTGIAPYQYSLDTGVFVDTNIFLDLVPMDYVVTTKDSLGCIKVDSVKFDTLTNFDIQSTMSNNETCVNTNDGKITVFANSMNPVQYSLDGMDYVDSPIFANLTPEKYVVYAKSNTCVDSAMVTILPAVPISLVNIAPQMAQCAGGNDGQITINVTGGKRPYAYKLDNGLYQGNNTFSSLAQGTYQMTVRDSNLCEQTFTNIILTDPVPLAGDCVVTQHLSTKGGRDGIANITVVGGTSPYNVQLVDAGFNNILTTTGLVTFENLPSGDYTVEIKDFNDCATTCNFTIDEPKCDFSIDKTQSNATCFEAMDGVISLILPTENTPFTINWSDAQYDGQEQLMGLRAGLYKVTVTNQVGCRDSLMISITEPPPLSVEIIADNATICEKDTAQLTLTSSYSQYNWSNAATGEMTKVSMEGTYQVTVKNAAGCVATDDIEISVITQDTTADTRFTCDESSVGTFEVAERGIDGCRNIVYRTFELARKDTTALRRTTCNPAEAGVLTNRFSNAFGCDSLVVITTELLASDTTYQMATSCNSDDVGIRKVVLSNAVGCDSTLIIETMLDGNSVSTFNTTATTCNPSLAGIDTLILKTFGGCDSLVITETISNASELTNLIRTTCNTQDVRMDTFLLTNQFLCDSLVVINTTLAPSNFLSINNQSCNPKDTGLVIQNLTNQFGCDSTVEISTTLSPINECQFGFSLIADTICWDAIQGTIQLTITEGIPPFDYFILNDFWRDTIQRGVIWTTDAATILTDIPVGQYSIILANDRSVLKEQRIAVTQEKELMIEGLFSDYGGFAVSCEGETDGSIDLKIMNGKAPYSYLWENGTQTDKLDNLAEGNYQVTVIDANGCQQSTTFDLFSTSEIQLDFQSFSPKCFGDVAGNITIYDLPNANGNVEYSLDGILFQPIDTLPFTIENLAPDDYQLFVQDANDCQASALFSVPMPNEHQLTLEGTTNLVLGDGLTISPKANFEIDRFEWTATVPLSCENCSEIKTIPTQNATYTLTAYDANDCKVTASTSVNLRKETQVYLPNAFSPNGDGNNDVYQVLTGNAVKTLKEMRIFDYEGRLMYQVNNRRPNDVAVGWDGLFNGLKMLPAVFVVLVEVELLDGTSVVYRQTMTLVE